MTSRLTLISNPFEPEFIELNLPIGRPLRSIISDETFEHVYLNKEKFSDLDYIFKDGDEVVISVEPGETFSFIIAITALALAAASAIYVLTNLPEDPDQQNGSNTYSLRGQSNIARLGEPIPVQYGEMRVYPDLISQPWIEYSGNEQYLHQVFAVGKGEFTISDIRISDTSITNFDDVTTEVLYEGPTTLFPSNVENSVEVANQQLSTSITGPFVANAANTDINKISVDMVFAEGVYHVRSNGSIRAKTTAEIGYLVVEYQEIDDSGTPIGSWIEGVNTALSGRSLSPLRLTYSFAVTAGRYQVRVSRTINPDANQERAHDRLLWEGMRGFIISDNSYPNTTILAVRMRATEQLSNVSRSKFNVFAQRKVPVWNGSTWNAAANDRNPAWAFADVLRDTDYGAGRSDSEIDLPSLTAFASYCTTNSYFFDGRFDTLTNIWKTLEQICAVGKAFPVVAFDVIGIKQETTQSLPAWTFNRANMLNENYNIVFDRDDDYDSVEGRYFDEENDYKEDDLTVTVIGSSDNPRNIDYRRGITNRDHLYIILKFLASKEAYSNLKIEFDTELEGYLPEKGDLISVASDSIGDLAIAGEVIEYNAGGPYVVLSQELTTDQAVQHGIMLRERDGSVSGPHNGTINGTNPARIDLSGALPFDPSPVAGEYNVIAAWGEVDYSFRDFIVLSISPKSENEISVEAIVYDSRIYDETGTAAAPVTRPELPRVAERPDVYNIRFENTAIPDIVAVSWQADQGWEYFVFQSSDNGGTDWSESVILQVPRIEVPVRPNFSFTLDVRVRAVGEFAGDWVTAQLSNVTDSDFTQPLDAVTGLVDPLSGADYDMETSLTYTWDSNNDIPQYYWTLRDGNLEIFLDGYTTGNSVTLSRSQVVACGTAATRVSGRIGRFNVYPTSYTQETNFAIGQSFDIDNAQMPAPNSVTLTESIGGFLISIGVTSPPNDFKGMQVFVGSSPGFSPDVANNMIYDGEYSPVLSVASDASLGQSRYVRVGLYDEFGKDSISLFGEQSITVTKDVESDVAIPTQFGSSLVQNSYLDQAIPRAGTGFIKPAGWYFNGEAEDDMEYSDVDRDKVTLTNSSLLDLSEMISTPFSVNVNTTYELVVRIRSTNSSTVTIGVKESTSYLNTDKIAFTQFTAEPFADDEIQFSTGSEYTTSEALTATFSIETFTYTPGASAVLACLFVRANAGEVFEIDYIYARDTSSFGAQTGENLLNEAGDLLEDIDIRNDQLVRSTLSAINFNPSFQMFRERNSGSPTGLGTRVPAGWFLSGTTTNGLLYVDPANPDIMLMPSATGTQISGSAILVNLGTTYEFVALVRSQSGTSDIYLNANELDTDLPTGKVSIGTSTSSENEIENRTRSLNVATGNDIGTSFTLISGTYTPTSTAKWFSPMIYADDDAGGDQEIEWIVVRDASTANTGYPDLGGLLFNSWMAIRDFNYDVPAGWYPSDTADNSCISYQNAEKTILNIASSSDSSLRVHSTAFQVNPNVEYLARIRLRGDVSSASGLYLRVTEYDSDLPEGKVFIRHTNTSPSNWESLAQQSTRERNSLTGGAENAAVPNTWTEYTMTWTPTSTAKWSSVAILNWTNHGLNELWIDRCSVEVNPAVLAGLDQVDTAEIINTAVTRLEYVEDFSYYGVTNTTWGQVLTDAIDVGSPLPSNAEVVIMYSADIDYTAISSPISGGGIPFDLELRIKNNATTVVDSYFHSCTPNFYAVAAGVPFTATRTYYRASAQTVSTGTATIITGFQALTGTNTGPNSNNFSLTLVSTNEFELDDAGTYLIQADFNVKMPASPAGGDKNGTLYMQDRTSGGSYANTPGTIKNWYLARSSSIVTADTVSIHAILNIDANHRFKFMIDQVQSETLQLGASGCRVTVTYLGGPPQRSLRNSAMVSYVARIPNSELVAGTNNFYIEARLSSTETSRTLGINDQKMVTFLRKV